MVASCSQLAAGSLVPLLPTRGNALPRLRELDASYCRLTQEEVRVVLYCHGVFVSRQASHGVVFEILCFEFKRRIGCVLGDLRLTFDALERIFLERFKEHRQQAWGVVTKRNKNEALLLYCSY